jgi:uncharacterized protein (TIGR00725 family)
MQTPPIKIGVMGSSSTSISAEDLRRVDDLAQRLGKKIAEASRVLITGELDGIPERAVAAHRQHVGLSVGLSPRHSAAEHAAPYGATPCPSTVVIYSGLGFKGHNVIAVRSADIVILFRAIVAFGEGMVRGRISHGD